MRRQLTTISCVLIVLAIFLILIPLLGTSTLNRLFGVDVSGWVQTGVALVGLPLLMFQLNQIRQALERKPDLEIGMVNIQDLPYSRVRQLKELPVRVDIATGYAHFEIILRNKGTVPARYVKVSIEHVNHDQVVTPPPRIIINEFSENKPTFIAEHNFEFIFRGGADWIIYPMDIEPFGFHVTTPVFERVTDSDGVHKVPMFPPVCEIILDCTVWAEGLDQPQRKRLTANVVPNLGRA